MPNTMAFHFWIRLRFTSELRWLDCWRDTRPISTVECSACYNVRSFLVGRTFAERLACVVARLWIHLLLTVVSVLAEPGHYWAGERSEQLEVSNGAMGGRGADASGDHFGRRS